MFISEDERQAKILLSTGHSFLCYGKRQTVGTIKWFNKIIVILIEQHVYSIL